MQTTEKQDMPELIEQITKASQKMTQNYFKNLSTYIHNDKDIAKTYATLFNTITWNPDELSKVQDSYKDFLQNQMEVSKRIMERKKDDKEYSPLVTPPKGDKRFLAPEWDEYPYFDYIKQNYLLVSELVMGTIENVELEDKTKRKLAFYTQQYLDILSPSNFFATNPEVIKMAVETKGESLRNGFKNLLEDIDKGRISQTDESAFEVGKNVAITPGSVIYENELIQLIQYTPVTKQVHEIPLLIIPPWINKYYILDLRPENSFAKFLVDQGFTVFMISWRNPSTTMGHLTFDDYVDKGTLQAIEVVKSVTGAEGVNALGYCLGGTLLGVSAAILGKRKSNALHSATFLASMLDFSDVGPMGDVIDEALVRKLERGELQNGGGVMHGHDMETAFNLIRANDLIWSYVVNNYLKGKNPTPFDVLYWTNDNTNLPAKMYIYYLRNMVLENKLSRKNALRICDELIDLAKITIPAFVVGTHEDHISPHRTAFTTTELLSGPVEFLLGGSGHVMGIVNPPAKKKYGYHINGKLENGYDEWKKTAEFHEGSWWTPYSKWLEKKSGKRIPAKTKLGNGAFKIIEPAPGRYAKEKNSKHPDHV